MTARKRNPYTGGPPGNPASARPHIPVTKYKCLDCGGYAEWNGHAWPIAHRPGCGTPGAKRAERVRQLAAEIHAARCHPSGWTPMAGCWGPDESDRAEAERLADAA